MDRTALSVWMFLTGLCLMAIFGGALLELNHPTAGYVLRYLGGTALVWFGGVISGAALERGRARRANITRRLKDAERA